MRCFNTLKRKRNEVLARLYVISSHIGKHDIYFVDDPTGNTSAKEKDKAQKIELAKMTAQALGHKEEHRHAQEQAKKEKQRKNDNPCMFPEHLIPTLSISCHENMNKNR